MSPDDDTMLGQNLVDVRNEERRPENAVVYEVEIVDDEEYSSVAENQAEALAVERHQEEKHGDR